MKPPPVPDNETLRLRHLRELEILDTLEEAAYDDLTSIAASICKTPIALVSLVDEDRQWFKSHHGMSARETPREIAFCAHAILGDETFIIENADDDTRFHDNPLVCEDPRVKFYAGVPLVLEAGIRLGTLCVIDRRPRSLSSEQRHALEALGRQVVSQLHLRLKIKALKDVDESRTEFLGTVSHELRTPLTSIFGGLSLLNSGRIELDSEKARGLIATSTRNADRLCQLVNDILDLTKIEAGDVGFRFEAVDLNDVVEESLNALGPFIVEQCRVRVVPDLRTGLPEIRADRNWMHQVVNNLLSNAAKFSPDGSTVTVSTSVDGTSGVLAVRDEGPGIPEDERERIFEKFFKTSNTIKGKVPGTGLGLNLVKKIVEAHGGQIEVGPAPGTGAVFSVRIPLDV